MKPIVLTEYGETLNEYPKGHLPSDHPGAHQDLPEHEAKKMSICIGIHAVCSCWMDIREISSTHRALTCRGCNLRFVIPKEVQTFGDLRAFCAERLDPKPE